MYARVCEDESIIRMLLSNLVRVDSALKLTRERIIRYRTFSLTLPAFMLFIGTKGSVCIRKEFNSHRIGLGQQHGRVSLYWDTKIWPPSRHVKTLYKFA